MSSRDARCGGKYGWRAQRDQNLQRLLFGWRNTEAARHLLRAQRYQWLRPRCQRWALPFIRTIDPVSQVLLYNSQRARIPATLTAKSKPDLELYALELLKKLRARDKKIEGELPRGMGRRGCMDSSFLSPHYRFTGTHEYMGTQPPMFGVRNLRCGVAVHGAQTTTSLVAAP